MTTPSLRRPDELSLVVAVVQYKNQLGRLHHGVCSTHLELAAPGEQLTGFVKPNTMKARRWSRNFGVTGVASPDSKL